MGVRKKKVAKNTDQFKNDKISKGIRDSWNYEFHDSIDPSIEIFYQPHNISLLVAFISGLVYLALFVLKDDHVLNAKVGISVAVFVLVITGVCNCG